MTLDRQDRPSPRWPVFGVGQMVRARARLSQGWSEVKRRVGGLTLRSHPARTLASAQWRRVNVTLGRFWHWIEPWMQKQPLWRFCTKSIGRRIISANLVGFVVLFSGLMFISQANRWLVEAKVDALRTQARTIAAALAMDARVETGRLTFDPERLLDPDGLRTVPVDETFADIRLPIAPEQVAPILHRLLGDGDAARARIYAPDGGLQIYDSSQRLQRGQIARANQSKITGDSVPADEKLRTFGTRFLAFFYRSSLPVYRDIGTERGLVYPEVAAALARGASREDTPPPMLLFNDKNEQIVAVVATIEHMRRVRGALLLSSRPGELDEILWRQRRGMLYLSLLALLASLLASWLLRRTIAGPMKRLSAAAEHVTKSINAQRELPEFPHRRDEIGAMATAFKEMTHSLYRRVEASDRFAQDVAHELKNPVAAARSTAESLRYAKSEGQRAELVEQIQGELKRLNRLITDVAKASRLDAELALQETEPVDLAKLVAGISGVLNDLHQADDKHVVMDLPVGQPGLPQFMVEGHEGRLGQVVNNLVDNAISFTAPGGTVRVGLQRKGHEVVLVIDDDGPGIPADRLEHVFKRFYSDRPQSDQIKGKNSGLGLSISKEIIAAHGGQVWAENRPAMPGVTVGEHDLPELRARRIQGVAGARFVVSLPALAWAQGRWG